jgi:membrane fusion protein (multidrug efflux system)
MFVQAIVKEGINEQAILIPQQSVSRDPKGNPLAMIIGPENKAVQVRLTLDRSIEDKWLVASGLKPGDQVIVEGLQRVRPDTVVRIAQPGTEPKPAESRQNPDKTAAPSK